jgi:hypothetical protein
MTASFTWSNKDLLNALKDLIAAWVTKIGKEIVGLLLLLTKPLYPLKSLNCKVLLRKKIYIEPFKY